MVSFDSPCASSPIRDRMIAGSPVDAFALLTVRIDESRMARGSNRALLLSIRMSRFEVSIASYLVPPVLTRSAVRTIASPVSRYAPPMQIQLFCS
jgi:translation elongation factor EF-4